MSVGQVSDLAQIVARQVAGAGDTVGWSFGGIAAFAGSAKHQAVNNVCEQVMLDISDSALNRWNTG